MPERTLNAVVADLERHAASLDPGARLPSVRELMARHRVGPVTVQRAVALLAARGVLEPRPGSGTYVAPRAPDPGAPDFAWQTLALGPRAVSAGGLEDLLRVPEPGAHVLSTGYLPADLQPLGALSQALARAARRPGAWDRMPLEGIAQLRGWFAAQVGGGVGEGDVIVCLGGQAALAACFRGLAAPGAPVLVESPTYLGALAAARAAGLEPVPVPSDADGVRPDLLEQAFAATGARVFYCQPTYANPHGAVLSPARRSEVLEVVHDAGAFLIEDEPFRDLPLEGEPPPPLLHGDPDGHVVHVRSLTKVVAPGLRISAVVARGPAAARLRPTRMVEGTLVPGRAPGGGGRAGQRSRLDAAPARTRAALRERRDALLAALRSELGAVPARPRGGMHLWWALEPEEDDVELVARAARAGVVVSPGRPYFPAEPDGPYLRLTFAAEPPERLGGGGSASRFGAKRVASRAMTLSSEEWRVEVDLDVSERLRSLDLDDEARERLGGRMIVTRDGPHVFLYATTADAAREGERVIRSLLEEDGLSGTVTLTRWDEEQDAWVAPSGEVVESAREDDGDGHFEWFVLVEGGDELAERLRAEGMPVEQRGRYVLVGSDDDEEVQALATRVRELAGPDADVQVRADLEGPTPAFVFFEAHKPNIARDLGL